MGAALWFASGPDAYWLTTGLGQRILHLSALVGLGGAVYFATLWLCGFRLRDFRRQAAT